MKPNVIRVIETIYTHLGKPDIFFPVNELEFIVDQAIREAEHAARIQGIKQAIVWSKSGGYDDLSEMTYKRIDEISQMIAAGLEAKNESL